MKNNINIFPTVTLDSPRIDRYVYQVEHQIVESQEEHGKWTKAWGKEELSHGKWMKTGILTKVLMTLW
jgi:hypothetical protein